MAFVERTTGDDQSTPSKQSKRTEVETTNWTEKTLKVLSILEQSGINIYSPLNTPGMYLKQKGSGIDSFFKESIPQQLMENDIQEKIDRSLQEFFKQHE